MNRWQPGFRRSFARALMPAIMAFCCVEWSHAQVNGYERTFSQPKATVEKALKDMQAALAGRLPVLDGFATSSDHSLDRYQRGYYQGKFQVNAAASGGSIVRVTVQVTAWYVDPVAARSGYQVLTSNGRLEADLLDQLADQLAGKITLGAASAPATASREPFPSERSASAQSSSKQSSSKQSSSKPSSVEPSPWQSAKTPDPAEPTISAPVPRLPETSGGFSSSLAQGLAEQEKAGTQTEQKKLAGKDQSGLQAEAASLEEILKNQAHPRNLVAIKKNGTPVVASASLTAKTLFLASAHDEFEMLDFNRDWVHVRISGLSRGWIWRNNLEMPDSVPDNDAPASPVPVAEERFHVTREETAPFPGDWAPLRGKNVKIVSVEKINEAEKDAGPQLKLEFAKSVFDKDYAELAQKPQELAGIVVIFDSVDGGMIAAAFPTLQQWKAGKLSDAALWHQCFFDPPETFNESGTSASQ
ncbi:MAG TPA: hypothetical protein VNX26_10470 [Candidatus Acidoferrum sp.]|jgi:hypothetical protein|nr:hypothetical protein [Candidatus Acidoferrum sp.]